MSPLLAFTSWIPGPLTGFHQASPGTLATLQAALLFTLLGAATSHCHLRVVAPPTYLVGDSRTSGDSALIQISDHRFFQGDLIQCCVLPHWLLHPALGP